jgi:hypothetical protein
LAVAGWGVQSRDRKQALRALMPIAVGHATSVAAVAAAHGAGLMLVPALAPLCMGDASTREITVSGSLMLALAAVGIHTAAMLAVTGLIASGVCRLAPAQVR